MSPTDGIACTCVSKKDEDAFDAACDDISSRILKGLRVDGCAKGTSALTCARAQEVIFVQNYYEI